MRNRANILKWGSVCLSLVLASGGVRAQAAPSADKAASGAGEAPNEIVVTGSRTSRDGYEAPTPVTTIGWEQMLRASPTNLPDALNQLPQFSNSLSQRNANTIDPSQQGGGNNLDLRSLGPNRVLILLDGRRVAPNNTRGYVDINTFPQLLVSRVDVVTAGVSAIYGADAVSGVVNFVLDKEFDGVKGYVQSGVSSHGDNGSYAGGIALGQSFADDRLHVLFSAEYYRSNGVSSFSARPHDNVSSAQPGSYEGWLRVGRGTAADPYRTLPNVRHTGLTFGGYVFNGPLARMAFRPDGALAPFDFGQQSFSRGFQIGGDGADWGDPTLMPSLETASAFGRAEYRISDNVKAYVQASYATSETQTENQFFNYSFYDAIIFQDNAFLAQPQRDLLQATNTASFALGRIHRDFGYVSSALDNKAFRLATGLDGSFTDNWNWSAFFTYGKSKLNGVISGQTKPVQFAAALDAVRAPNGNIVCRVTITNPGLRDDCVPLNIFGESMPSQAAIDYVTGDNVYKVINDALEFGAEVSGDLFTLPGGPLTVALGGSFRRQSIDQTSNSDPAIPIDTTGVRGAASNRAFTQTNFGSAKGSNNAKEVFFEATAPILADLPLIHKLTLNGAARYVDYSSFGSKFVWKAGFVHEITPDLRFRLTKSRDIRAPSLDDQFSGRLQLTEIVSDPLTGRTGAVSQIGGGNPDLQPEKGDTLTFGLGYQPKWISGLSLSADYYDVKIVGAINSIPGQTLLNLCHASGYTDPLCDLVSRPFPISNTSPANFPTQLTSLVQHNVGFLRTKGIDFEASYRFDPGFVPGSVSIRLLANHVDSFKIQNSPGVPTFEYAGFIGRGLLKNADGAIPKWRVTGSIAYKNGPFSMFIQERFIESVSNVGGNTPNDVYADGSGRLPSVFYTDLSVEYEIKGGAKFFFTVNNLFDRDPPLLAHLNLPNIIYPSAGTVYDVVGRYMTIGLRAKF